METMGKMYKMTCVAVAAFSVLACSEWLEPESINKTDLNATIKTDEYYAALREWKNTPGLPQVFVWYDNWTGVSPTGEHSMRGLPDSVTLVSSWGASFGLTPEMKADMEYVQRVKGTKVVVTLFSSNVGDSVDPDPIYEEAKREDASPEIIREAIKTYARAIYDAVIEEGYDGYDWDYEPMGGMGGGPLWTDREQRTMFVEELSYWFGKGAMDPSRDRGDRPLPAHRLLFLVDGEIGFREGMDPDWVSYYIDYFVLQTYNNPNLQSRVEGVLSEMDNWIQRGHITPDEVVRRTICTENFESYAGTGGGFLNMSRFIYEGTWNVNGSEYKIDQQIGGCGIYRPGFDYDQGKGDYNGSPEYYYLRQGITNLYEIYNERKNSIFHRNDQNKQ